MRSGIAGLGRKFRIIDDDGNRQLNLSEFGKAIREHALDLSAPVRTLQNGGMSECGVVYSSNTSWFCFEQETEELFRFIDADNSGGINFDEFLIAIRVSMCLSVLSIFCCGPMLYVFSFRRAN